MAPFNPLTELDPVLTLTTRGVAAPTDVRDATGSPTLRVDHSDPDLLWQNISDFSREFESRRSARSEAGTDYLDELSHAYAELVGNARFADVVFVVDDIEIPAHSAVLYVRCPYFRKLLERVGHWPKGTKHRIAITGIGVDVFLALLRFLYCGVTELQPADLLPLLAACYEFELFALAEIVESAIADTLSVDSICDVLRQAVVLQNTVLLDATARFVRAHISSLVGMPSFRALSQPVLLHVLDALVTGGEASGGILVSSPVPKR